ncbi:unnamed protein product [Leptidea sinapis]|uniref:Uncharacterized protein n=1 Tax=Leptidea sinapis TaxID=189913 RepID=A0A5E4QZI5_9NEOP|nr:unnamed protein product [Leptidea sinapis]
MCAQSPPPPHRIPFPCPPQSSHCASDSQSTLGRTPSGRLSVCINKSYLDVLLNFYFRLCSCIDGGGVNPVSLAWIL